MAIKRKVPITLEFETEDDAIHAIELSVLDFDKKKKKQLKVFAKKLDKEYKALNTESKDLAKTRLALAEKKEDLEDLSLIIDGSTGEEQTEAVLSRIALRKEIRKEDKSLEKLVEKYRDKEDEQDEVQGKVLRKQIELMVEKPSELLTYIEENSISLLVIISEIFKLLKASQKN